MKYLFLPICILFIYISNSYANTREMNELIHSIKNTAVEKRDATRFTGKITKQEKPSIPIKESIPPAVIQPPVEQKKILQKENISNRTPPLILEQKKILQTYNKDDTEEINGLVHLKNNPIPLTGIVIHMQHSLLVSRRSFKNGIDHGQAQYFYPDGTLQKEEYFLNRNLHGRKRTFSMYGIIIDEGHYENGKKHGTFSSFFVDGTLKEKVSYIADKREGKALLYHQNKQIKEISQYYNDLLTGEQEEFNTVGVLIRTTLHERGLRQGIEKHYTKRILSKAIPYIDDRREGDAYIFRENGKDISIVLIYTKGAVFNAFCYPSNGVVKQRLSEEDIHLWDTEGIIPPCI